MSKEERTNAIFDRLWAGKRVWDALADMEGNRNVHPEKAINLKRVSTRGYDGAFHLKYTMDWKDAGFKVVLNGECRPWSGWFDMLWDSFFGSQDDKCLVKAVKWLDAACGEEQTVLVNVEFMFEDTPIEGVKRNAKLVELFIKYLNSLEPEVSVTDANFKADEVIRKAAMLDRALDLVSGTDDLDVEDRN
jgi:hypothetical protein